MHQFKNIVLVYPCDDSTLERATNFANENGASLTLVQVLKSDPVGDTLLQIGTKSVKLQELIRHEHENNLREIAESLSGKCTAADWRLLYGNESIEIIRDVIENKRDLVIMTAEGKPGFAERIFGSVSSQLIRKCPVPVLVAKPGESKSFQKIFAAIDPVLVGDDHSGLNNAILKLASGLADREQGELHVVHSWVLVGESLILGRGGLTQAALADIFETESRRRLGLMKDALSQAGITRYVPHVAKGEPSKAIPQLVHNGHADLLVMGTVCRTGIPGFLIGNTAESILNEIDCSVLVIKPEKFTTPVVTAQVESSASASV